MYLRQSTPATRRLGPFVDSTDGDTEETGLTIANTDVLLSKNGGAYAAATNGATHDTKGNYSITLAAGDVNTVGILDVYCHPTGALPVVDRFYVLEEAIYDALFTSGLSSIPVAVASIAANAITASAIATDAITAAKIAADAIGASELAADAVAEIRDAVNDEQIADSVPADGTLPTMMQMLYMVGQFLMEQSRSGTAITVKKVDGSTTLFGLTIDSGDAPSSVTRSS